MSIHTRTADFVIVDGDQSRAMRWTAFAGAAIVVALCLAVLASPFLGARIAEAPSSTDLMSGP